MDKRDFVQDDDIEYALDVIIDSDGSLRVITNYDIE